MGKHRAERGRDQRRDSGDCQASQHRAAKFVDREHADEMRKRQMMWEPMRRPREGLKLGRHRLFREKIKRQNGGRKNERVQRYARSLETGVHVSAPSSRENRRAAMSPPMPIIVTIRARIIEAAIASCGFCASSHKLYE